MATIAIHTADAGRFEQVLALLAANGLPEAGLADHMGTTLIAEADGDIVGSAALELYGQAALLRSVAVDHRFRNCGLGHRLVDRTLELATQRQVRRVYLLTETAVPYFARLGFQAVARGDVDRAVTASVEFQSVCPQSAQAMVRVLV